MAARFSGPKFPLSRSKYGLKPRQAKDAKLNKLRAMARVPSEGKVFEKAVQIAKPRKDPR